MELRKLGVPFATVLLALALPASMSAETHLVRRGENLQATLNAAAPGDVVLLEAGAEYVGNFVLPVKAGDAPIAVRTVASTPLPLEGTRIHPSHAPLLARLRSPNALSVLRTAPGAHHWELAYLEIAANQNGYGDILQIGDGSSAQNTLTRVPHHFVLDHLYVHGDKLLGQKRCISLNAAHVAIRDSHVSDCKGVGNDTQAIGGWNGPGPYTIENNYLEAAGENVLFGGSDPAIPSLVADGITIRRNHFSRPVSWRDPIVATPQGLDGSAGQGGLPSGTYSYRVVARRSVGQGVIGRSSASIEVTVAVGEGGATHLAWQAVPDATEYRVYGRTPGSQTMYWTVTATSFIDNGSAGTSGTVPTTAGTVWTVKNLFELKNARNVTVEGNLFENHWKEAQPGYAIVLTPRNSGGSCDWCVVEHVRFENNIVRRVSAGVNVLGYDIAARPTQQTKNLVFRNNLFYDVGQTFDGNGWLFLLGDEPRDIIIDHNTMSHGGSSILYAYGGTAASPRQVQGVRITNNAVRHAAYGINGDFFGYGLGVIGSYMPGSTVTANYFAGGPASRYPVGNLFGGSFESEFVDPAAGDFRLRSSSVLRGAATDGRDIGADVGALLFRTSGVEAGNRVSAPRNLRIVR